MDWSRCAGATWRYDARNAPAGAFELFEELFDYASRVTGMEFRYGGPMGDGAVPPGTFVMGWRNLDTAGAGRPEIGVVLGAAQPGTPERGAGLAREQPVGLLSRPRFARRLGPRRLGSGRDP